MKLFATVSVGLLAVLPYLALASPLDGTHQLVKRDDTCGDSPPGDRRRANSLCSVANAPEQLCSCDRTGVVSASPAHVDHKFRTDDDTLTYCRSNASAACGGRSLDAVMTNPNVLVTREEMLIAQGLAH